MVVVGVDVDVDFGGFVDVDAGLVGDLMRLWAAAAAAAAATTTLATGTGATSPSVTAFVAVVAVAGRVRTTV